MNLSPKTNEKVAALGVCVLGIILAMVVPISQYENFLYLIGSIFAPLFAILLTDYFIFQKKTVIAGVMFSLKNTLLWIVGVVGYQLLLPYSDEDFFPGPIPRLLLFYHASTIDFQSHPTQYENP